MERISVGELGEPLLVSQVVPNYHIRQDAFDTLMTAAYVDLTMVSCRQYGIDCGDRRPDEPLPNETVVVFHPPSGMQLLYEETLDGIVVHRYTVTRLSLRDAEVVLPPRRD